MDKEKGDFKEGDRILLYGKYPATIRKEVTTDDGKFILWEVDTDEEFISEFSSRVKQYEIATVASEMKKL